ncbi:MULTISPECIES: hypothetical protein [unclassified Mesorhizobium]|uniref:hypothetical protein n=1 Tax=unclassified Mesorhizobium TaxID=325217 RepID=UPI001FDFA43E|nr:MULTISPECIES: hypothetical protein [unclassified Mesorhizobium]
MRRAAAREAEASLDAGKRRSGLHLVDNVGVPAEGGIEIIEETSPRHESLA